MGIHIKDITRRITAQGLRPKNKKEIIFSYEPAYEFVKAVGMKPKFVDLDISRDPVAIRLNKKNTVDTGKKNQRRRAGTVAVLGHVDHGKTTLLDTLRNTSVAQNEAGLITQSLTAFKVPSSVSQKPITFLDTPGHQAFFRMRSNGAKVSDLILLMVAGDQGVQGQTLESFELARQASIPILVAINKMDLPTSKPHPIISHLKSLDIPSDPLITGFVEISAKRKWNIDKLEQKLSEELDKINLWEDADEEGQATVIEMSMKKGIGKTLRAIVHTGTLKIGQSFVVGYDTGKIKGIYDDNGRPITEAFPGDPVEIFGLEHAKGSMPEPGDDIFIVSPEKTKQVQELRHLEVEYQNSRGVYDEALMNSMDLYLLEEAEDPSEDDLLGNPTLPTLNIVLKADNIGSLQAIYDSARELEEEGVQLNVISSGVGDVTATDLVYCVEGSAPIYCFNVGVYPTAQTMLKARPNLQSRLHNFSVFYHLLDDIKAKLQQLKGNSTVAI
eukprot:CAMPEP_0174257974 /NCGR_PEP_ID=MMETSP0439-20130205/7059_1 /TAXON_ID=0 /ORGANISM="Stereomyxa ramosa, Strain Chinc5" /LENGTH=498 /DNA_ID=CAMNT_0015341305 /DNA_START=187 /DNA_END=1686 /DNA_ORIENTATION=-